MELNNKEKKIKQVLTDVNFDIDTDFLWKEVSNELDKKKKRRFLWFIPFGVLGIWALVFLFSNYSLESANAISSNNALDQTLGSIEETIVGLEHKSTQEINDPKIEETVELTNKTEKVSNPTIFANTSKQTNRSKNLINKKSQTTLESKDQRLSNVFLQKEIAKGNSLTSNKLNNSIIKKLNTETSIADDTTYKILSDIINFNQLARIPFSTFKYSIDKLNIGNDRFESISVADKNAKRFYVELALGGIQNITTKNTIDGELSNEYFNKEIEMPGVNAGILFGLQTKKDWRVFGGFGYSQLITRYIDSDVELTESIIEIDDQQTINAQGDSQTNNGYLHSITTNNKDITWHKRHQEFNLQLGVSKNLLTNTRYRIAPEVSVIQNLYSSHSGYYFSELPPHFTKFNGSEENPYRINTGLKTQLSLNVGYQFSGLEFNINTAWTNPLSTITKESNFYQIKNSQLSIQARVNYLLNWENK